MFHYIDYTRTVFFFSSELLFITNYENNYIDDFTTDNSTHLQKIHD